MIPPLLILRGALAFASTPDCPDPEKIIAPYANPCAGLPTFYVKHKGTGMCLSLDTSGEDPMATIINVKYSAEACNRPVFDDPTRVDCDDRSVHPNSTSYAGVLRTCGSDPEGPIFQRFCAVECSDGGSCDPNKAGTTFRLGVDGPPLGECCPPPNLEYGEEYSDKRPTIMDVGGHVQMLGDGREVRGYAYSGYKRPDREQPNQVWTTEDSEGSPGYSYLYMEAFGTYAFLDEKKLLHVPRSEETRPNVTDAWKFESSN